MNKLPKSNQLMHQISMERVLVTLAFLFAATRFFGLKKMPPFLDETIYLAFADKIVNDPSQLFISLKAAVLPVMVWFLSLVNLFFSNFFNPLLTGRILMTTFDIFSAFLIYLIGKKIFDKKYALVASLIYLSLPLVFFHSRIILLESMTNFFFLVGIYFILQLSEGLSKHKADSKTSFKPTILAGLFLALSFLTKPLALVSFGVVPLVPLIVSWKSKNWSIFRKVLIQLIIIFAIFAIIILPFVIFSYRNFNDYHINSSSSLSNLISHFKLNLWRSYWWLKVYLTSPILVISLLTLIFGVVSKNLKITVLGIWASLVVLIDSFVGTNFYPRHLVPISAPVALIAAYPLAKISNWRFLFFPLLVLILIPLWKLNFEIVSNPANAPIALEDRQQFYKDWSSGKGLEELAIKLNELSLSNRIDVYVENEPLLAWGLPNIYDVGNTKIIASDDLFFRKEKLTIGGQNKSFVVLNREPGPLPSWPLKLIASFPKDQNRSINLFEYQN